MLFSGTGSDSNCQNRALLFPVIRAGANCRRPWYPLVMCGRYNLRSNRHLLADLFGVLGIPSLSPRWNIAPTQQVLSIRLKDSTREGVLMRWGLVPSWSKDPKAGAPLINARSESVREKPSFRSAFKARRCLVPASGFYEWQTIGAGKQPYHITMADGQPFAIAGLWEHWHGDDNVWCIADCSVALGDTESVTSGGGGWEANMDAVAGTGGSSGDSC